MTATRRAASTRSNDLRAHLEEAIIEGKLVPGQRLDENEIAQRFRVSRTPVREALRTLAASGLVEIRARQGAVVATTTIPALIEMFEVMAELEGLCVRLACRRITQQQMRALEAAHKACVESVGAEDPEGFNENNRLFHEIIYAAAHNRFLENQTKMVRNGVGAYRRYLSYQPGRMAGGIEEHEAMIKAIRAGDAEAGHRLMREHVSLLGDRFADLISSLPPGFGPSGETRAPVIPKSSRRTKKVAALN